MSTQQPPEQNSSESESVFTRFRRSLSGSFSQTNAPSSQPSTQKTEDIHSTSRPTTPRQPTTFEKLISLGQSRKDWEVDFPPPHWSDQTGSVLGAPAHEPPPTTNPTREANNEPPPEPTTLAKRIQSMLASIPPILPSNSAQEPKLDGEGPPPKLVSDPKMISFLSSPGIMNGSLSKSGQSVWSVLDRLRAQLPGQDKHRTDIPLEERKDEEEVLDDDESGVMIYGPLLPTADSEVELAKSEMVPHDNEESKQDGKKVPVRKETIANKLERMWPFGKEKENDEPSESRVFFQPVKEKRVWIPSKDKISIQVMWWGYRIYLPPPVLDVLDNTKIEGAKRAAMLTAALKWLLDRVPMAMLPPQARPAMAMLKAFTPYLGYVGGVVAWSWGAVKTFDKGNGVTLTATWLLSVAVIPGTWEAEEIPGPVDTPRENEATHQQPSGPGVATENPTKQL